MVCELTKPFEVPPASYHDYRLRSWLRQWQATFGIPENYYAIHMATTGLDPATDLIVELAFCEVKNGSLVDRYRFVPDWRHEREVS